MQIELTKNQEAAVKQNGNILVAAAAGSGKTAVLVERVINKLSSKTNPISADRLLIVTFTNAAAAEMRSRIEKRLDDVCRENPEDTGLMLQKRLLSSAKICTIDSFCIDLVRENFEKVGVSPDFTLGDSFAIKAVNEKILSQIVNRYIEENDPVFLQLLDIIGAEFDEGGFNEFVLKIYEYSRQLPFPNVWFDSLEKVYEDGVFSENNPWRIYALSSARERIEVLRNNIANAIDFLMCNEKAAEVRLARYVDVSDQLAVMAELCDNNDWDGLFNALNNFRLLDIKQLRGVKDWEVTVAANIFDRVVKVITEDLTKFFYADTAFINSQFEKINKPLKLLVSILKEFDTTVFEALKEENTFTFHHTEHLALQILCSGDESAKEFLDRYDEVCVDEYQDTNDLQNMLFYVLSNRDSKLFAVGDVKQSIYGFRGANPEHFLSRKNDHIPYEIADNTQPKKIILAQNFRCKPQVCDFTNYFFKMFMTDKTGEIIYNDEEKLIPAATYPETDIPAVSMDIIDASDDETKNMVIEARQIAVYIKKMMAAGEIIRVDKTAKRQAKYSDFSILLRSMKNKAAILASELKKQGIPANYNAEGYIEFTEIATMLSLLRVIDNPNSDIELLAVMMSPIFGFTAEEMAVMRTENKKTSLYSAVCTAANNGNAKVKEFLDTIQRYRLFAVTNTLPRLIDILLEETSLIDTVYIYSDGSRRKNNLLLLCEYARQYDSAGNRGITGFVNHIVKQSENGIKSALSDSGEDTVKIMTIHSSKGLQFPVCIVADTAKNFYVSEITENNIYSTKDGIGFKYFDEDDKVRYTTIGREVILDKIKRQQKQEELRLLYVAMTRTQDFLHFTYTAGKTENKTQELAYLLLANNCKITADVWDKLSSYGTWLLTALLLHPDCKALRESASSLICNETTSNIEINLINSEDVLDNSITVIHKCDSVNGDLCEAVKENIEFEYPFSELLKIESKASVSSLANKAESEKYAFKTKPSFMSENGINAAQKGTAMHKVMEFFDFHKWENIEEEIERLYEWQFLSENEAKSINIEALKMFFSSDIFKRILNAKTVKREMRFLTELPVSRVAPDLKDKFTDENIIVQGAVDVCFIEEDGVVILDFKTDRTDNPNDLAEKYGEQLKIYAAACEKIFEKPIKDMIIYSFFQSREISI